MKTLIIGSNGMLGHALAHVFAGEHTRCWDRADLDITDEQQVQEKITRVHPELIINAAAYTAVDACEHDEESAMRVNGDAVGFLARVARDLGATFVHYSTDYVFDGTQKEGYREADAPNPINAYGRTKLAGEHAVQSSGLDAYYLIRISWLYGPNGKNFVDTMLGLGSAEEPWKIVDDQIGSPTYTLDIAAATKELLDEKKPYGIYHRTNSGRVSWYGFAKEIFKVLNKDTQIAPCTTAEFPRPAKRPSYSVLQSAKLKPMRAWQEALKEYLHNKS